MGLDIKIGLLANVLGEQGSEAGDWPACDFRLINEVLESNGCAAYQEPETLPPLDPRGSGDDFPYGWLHYLRRFYAHVVTFPGRTPPPVETGEEPDEDPVLRELFEDTFDTSRAAHLLFHSDCDGFYVPVDFQAVIYDDRLPGGTLGSSYQLRDELQLVAAPLGIRLDQGQLGDDEAARLAEFDEAGQFYRERAVWFSLFERARLSLENHTAICFR
jgi:hypothetical protein